MINYLKNESEMGDRGIIRTNNARSDELNVIEKRFEQNRLSKCTSYQSSTHPSSKTNELNSYSVADSHKNQQMKYANISSSVSNEGNSRDGKYMNGVQRHSYHIEDGEHESFSNNSNELSSSNRFK